MSLKHLFTVVLAAALVVSAGRGLEEGRPLAKNVLHARSATTPFASSSTVRPTAVIGIGTIKGKVTKLPQATSPVNKFLGVPFAKSPPTRFMPPEAAANLTAPLVTQGWRPACVQQFVYPLLAHEFALLVFNQPPPRESEDCLYLNVYAPANAPPPGGYAVMFWIYGGGLQFGDAGQPGYDGSAFAAYQDVIVVSPNYRTNVFGFPGAPGMPVSKNNLGFLDQQFALQWVQDNIAAFGGNPDRVTIFGESAGAFSVDALLTAPIYNGGGTTAPFQAAILESGQISYRSYPFASNSTGEFIKLAQLLNCSSTPGPAQFSCVQKAPATTIKNIIEQNILVFNPVPDGVTLAADPAAARMAGKFVKAPIMGGTNAQEGRVFEVGQSNLTAFLNSNVKPIDPSIIPAIKAAFPVGNIKGYNTGYDVISEIFTLLEFQCGAALQANETHAQGVPTWRYYFNASFPNYSPLNGLLGVFHSSEIPLVFATYPGGPVNIIPPKPLGLIPANLPPTAQQDALSKYMNGAWANFAKNPMGGPGWNALGTYARQDLGVLGTNGSSGVTVIQEQIVDSKCQVLAPLFKIGS